MKKIFLFLFLSTIALFSFSQRNNFTLSGFIEDSTSGERLPGATILINDRASTKSNQFGYYTITTAISDSVKLSVSYAGYVSFETVINTQKDNYLIIQLTPDEDFIGTVYVIAKEQSSIISNEIGKISMPVDAIKKMPRILGENDVLKSLQTLPGITQGMEGSSGILVRGGGPDQNLFLLDGTTVYNPTHLGGIFSPFNADAIKTVDVYKGGFPARYGSRLSSVVDMVIKDGNMKKLDGEGSVGMLSSKFLIEGPIKKEQTSFLVSGRRTYLDALAKPLIGLTNDDTEKRNLGFYFYDVYGKINHIISDKNRVYASFFAAKDNYKIRTKTNNKRINYIEDATAHIKWSNVLASVRWNHIFSQKLFSNTTLNFTNYRFGTYSDVEAEDNKIISESHTQYYSNIRDFGLKTDLEFRPNPQHTLRFGGAFVHHTFSPGISSKKYNSSIGEAIDKRSDFNRQNSPDVIAYVEDQWKPHRNFEMNIGLHGNLFKTDTKVYSSIQPRISANYYLPANYTLKASYLHANQNIHLLAYNAVSLPTDLWVPSTDKVKPMLSKQTSFGITKKIPDWEVDISLESYYKTMDGVIEYKDGASPFNSSAGRWDDMVEQGKGKAYGFEFLWQKKLGRSTAWASYAWSKSDRKFDTINFGKPFFYKYDRRHVINLVYMYKLNERWDFSAVWQFQSGAPYTLPTAKYEYQGIYSPYNLPKYLRYNNVEYISGRNEFRLLDYHRLDVSFTWHKPKRNYEKFWNFSLYNVYNRKNPMLYSIEHAKNIYMPGEQPMTLQGKAFLPFFPSVSYSIKF